MNGAFWHFAPTTEQPSTSVIGAITDYSDRKHAAAVQDRLACTKEKPGRDGPVQFAGVGAPTITFQRGTAACIMVAIWEDGATESPRSNSDYASAVPVAQRKASHVSHAKTGNIFALFTQVVEERRTLGATKTA